MKIGRYQGTNGEERLGIVVGEKKALKVLDLARAASAQNKHQAFPVNMDGFIDAGTHALDSAYDVIEWAKRQGDSDWFVDEKSVPWMIPLNVRNCIAGGRNFAAHRAETLEYWTKQGAKLHSEIPMGFIKLASSMVPTRSTVHRPLGCEWFDYEVEATAVIGQSVTNVNETDGLKAIFGYTILNDLSAREMQRKEVRQEASCSDLIFPFPALVSHWSKMGLARGDLITVGSPEGVAIGRPDPMAFYLQSGDVVSAEVTQIGALETYIA